MDVLDTLSDEELVCKFCDFLRTPPHSWPIDSRGNNSLQYHILDYFFTIEFKEGWKYHLKIERRGTEATMWGEVPYTRPKTPNLPRLFDENLDLGRRRLTDRE